MKKSYLNLQKNAIYAAVMLIWCVLSVVVLIAMNIQTSLASIAILVFVAVLALIRPFPLASWFAMLAGSLTYAAISYSLFGLGTTMLLTSGLAFAIYLVTSLLGNMFARQIGNLRDQFEKEHTLMDDLVQYDQSTGILRWKFAQQRLKAEVLRSVRYKKDLSLALIQVMVPANAQLSEIELAGLYSQVVDVLVESLRKDIDMPFIGEKMGILLPETTSEGAQIFSTRLVEKVFRKTRVDVAIGIASVPGDAVTTEDLLEQAELALKLAASGDQPVIPAARLRAAAGKKEQPEEEFAAPQAGGQAAQEALGPREWLLEIQNFKNMGSLPDLEKKIRESGALEAFSFLRLEGNKLTAKVSVSGADPAQALGGLPFFTPGKVDAERRVIQIKMKTEK